MSVLPTIHHLLKFFPQADTETLLELQSHLSGLERYLAAQHDLTIQEARETIAFARFSQRMTHSIAA